MLRIPSVVISTEAPHGIIVSSAAEKSAFLPQLFANPHRELVFAAVLAVVVAFAVGIGAGLLAQLSNKAAHRSAEG